MPRPDTNKNTLNEEIRRSLKKFSVSVKIVSLYLHGLDSQTAL